jgi:C-terminal processing protease CtpA/Prc
LDEEGETINSTDDKFLQPSDKDTQGNVLPDEEIKRKIMADVQRTPSKEDNKPAAQTEVEESPLSANKCPMHLVIVK